MHTTFIMPIPPKQSDDGAGETTRRILYVRNICSVVGDKTESYGVIYRLGEAA
jgi:hypothetical protein